MDRIGRSQSSLLMGTNVYPIRVRVMTLLVESGVNVSPALPPFNPLLSSSLISGHTSSSHFLTNGSHPKPSLPYLPLSLSQVDSLQVLEDGNDGWARREKQSWWNEGQPETRFMTPRKSGHTNRAQKVTLGSGWKKVFSLRDRVWRDTHNFSDEVWDDWDTSRRRVLKSYLTVITSVSFLQYLWKPEYLGFRKLQALWLSMVIAREE